MKLFLKSTFRTVIAPFAAVLLGAMATVPASAQIMPMPLDGSTLSTPGRTVPESDIQIKLSFAPVVKQTAPAVVNIYTERKVRQRRDPFMELFGRGMDRERVESSLGSGVIVRSSGVIVTNAHVVKGATELRVVLSDRREFSAKLIAEDEESDLAVLEIDTKGERLPVLSLREDSDVEIGDIVLAIGNPFGVGQSVSNGIVSATGRTGVTGLGSFIQTDAAVNPGNSGGALVDLNGELIGVNTAIFSRSGGSNGIGFAIPSELVSRAVESALSDGEILRPWIGARTNGVDTTMAQAMGLDRSRGAIISDLYPGGPAELAGLEEGDIILSVNGSEINDDSGLRFRLATLRPGDRMQVEYWRNNRERTVSVRAELPKENPLRDERDLVGSHPLNGAIVVNMNPVFAEEVDLDPFVQGVLIKTIARRSVAYANGFRAGDIIIEINDEVIDRSQQLQALLTAGVEGDDWKISIDRRGRIYNVPVRYLPRLSE